MKHILLTILLLLFTANTYAAMIVTDINGQLLGATGVKVGSTFYDVEFVDGTCTGLFSGCDEPGDFIFNTEDGALAAAEALLDQVFINSDRYGLVPRLTNGCEFIPQCTVIIPYAVAAISPLRAAVAAAANRENLIADFTTTNQFSGTINTIQSADVTYAVFTSVQPVPVPAAVWLFMSGLLGLVYKGRKAGQAAA